MKMSTENSYNIKHLYCFSSWEIPNKARERTVFWKINNQKCYWCVYNSLKEKKEVSGELRTIRNYILFQTLTSYLQEWVKRPKKKPNPNQNNFIRQRQKIMYFHTSDQQFIQSSIFSLTIVTGKSTQRHHKMFTFSSAPQTLTALTNVTLGNARRQA